jgi:hypothetical protein
MEEMSFRSGAAVVAGVLVIAGVAIALTVVLGGHNATATSPPRPAAARSTPSPSLAPAAALPSATAQATPMASLGPAGDYQPSTPVTAARTPQPSATSAAGLPTPRHPRPTPTPHVTGQPVPVIHNPGGLSPHGRRHGLLRGQLAVRYRSANHRKAESGR